MSQIAFLSRIRRFFTGASARLDGLADAWTSEGLRQPAHPMSDQELARAIREFQGTPLSEASPKKRASRPGNGKPQD